MAVYCSRKRAPAMRRGIREKDTETDAERTPQVGQTGFPSAEKGYYSFQESGLVG